MHHNTKRPKSPVRHKSIPARPIVIGKISKAEHIDRADHLGKVDRSAKIDKHAESELTVAALNAKLNAVSDGKQSAAASAIHKHPVAGSAMQKQHSAFNPQEFIKQNAVRNTYDICMIKKFIGKKLLIPAKGLLLTPKVKDEAKHIKAALLANENQKNIILHVVCINGTMHIINGYSNYLAIGAISYKDIDTNLNLRNTEIKLIQLPKLSNAELRILLEYFT
jgi:hypothetical protein